MAIQTKQVEVAKEIDDVLAAVIALVNGIKSGKSLAEVGASLVGPVMDAVAGIDQAQVELAANRKAVLATIGLRVGELTDLLLAA